MNFLEKLNALIDKKENVHINPKRRELIKAAEEDIRIGDYRQAREHARLSREMAIEARRLAEGPAAQNR